MEKEHLIEFYRKQDLSGPFSYISRPGWRHFRIVNEGRFTKLDRPLRDCASFKTMLIRETPSDVYYSTSMFLNPHKLGPRTEEAKHRTVFLRSDIVFDIDRIPFSLHNIDKARMDALALLCFMKRDPRYIAFSGAKGFHIVYDDDNPSAEPDPYKREMETIAKRRALVQAIEKAGIHIDSPITADTRRILRVPGTINPKTGMSCTILALEDMQKDAKHILSKVPKAWSIPVKRYNLLGHFQMPKARTQRQIRRFHSTYMSNSVLGIKSRYVPIIMLQMSEKTALLRFREITKAHRLPQLLVFKTRKGYAGVSFRTYQKNELLRLLMKTESANVNEFLKYKQNFLELDMTEKGAEPAKKTPIKIIAGSWDGCESRGHHTLFSYLNLWEPRQKHGSEEVKLTYAIETA